MNKDEYVYYVCYGSNLYLERFMLYLTGKGSSRFNIKENPQRKCNNQNPPIDIKVVEIPYELYFGGYSSTWSNKGVAYIDPYFEGHTIGRAYKITLEQYEHVKKFEGSNYSKEIELAPIDGVRAITFTSAPRMFPDNPPSELYYEVIFNGLIDCGLSNDEAKEYLNKRILK